MKYFYLIFLVLCSCELAKDDFHHKTNESGLDSKSLTIESLQQSLLSTKCLSCHDGSNAPGDFSNKADILKYVTPGDLVNSPLYLRVTTNNAARIMPPGNPLTSEEIDLIRQVILNLSQPPKPEPEPEPEVDPNCEIPEPPAGENVPLEATYHSLKSNLFKPMCIDCHNQKSKRRIPLECESFVKENIFDILDYLEQGDMPPESTGNVVSDEILEALKLWVEKDVTFAENE